MARIGSTYPYLYQIATERRTPSVNFAKRLAKASLRQTPLAPLTVAGLLGL